MKKYTVIQSMSWLFTNRKNGRLVCLSFLITILYFGRTIQAIVGQDLVAEQDVQSKTPFVKPINNSLRVNSALYGEENSNSGTGATIIKPEPEKTAASVPVAEVETNTTPPNIVEIQGTTPGGDDEVAVNQDNIPASAVVSPIDPMSEVPPAPSATGVYVKSYLDSLTTGVFNFALQCSAIFSSIVLQLTPVATVAMIVKKRSTGPLPPLTYFMMFFSSVLWLIYGLMRNDIIIILPNVTGFLLGALYVTVYSKFCTDTDNHETLAVCWKVFGAALAAVSCSIIFAGPGLRLVGLLAACSSVISYSAPLSALNKILKDKSTSSMPSEISVGNFLSSVFWLLYGNAADDKFLIVTSFLGATAGALQVCLLLWFPATSPADFHIATSGKGHNDISSYPINEKQSDLCWMEKFESNTLHNVINSKISHNHHIISKLGSTSDETGTEYGNPYINREKANEASSIERTNINNIQDNNTNIHKRHNNHHQENIVENTSKEQLLSPYYKNCSNQSGNNFNSERHIPSIVDVGERGFITHEKLVQNVFRDYKQPDFALQNPSAEALACHL